jgi:adenosine deaminase
MFLRHAARHQERVCVFSNGSIIAKDRLLQLLNETNVTNHLHCNLIFQHMRLSNFLSAADLYSSAMMRPYTIVTQVREPLSHALSWLSYIDELKTIKEIADAIDAGKVLNRMCHDFAINNEADLNDFIARTLPGLFVCPTESLDECAVVLRRKFSWSYLDITYMNLHDSHDGK